MRHPRRHLDHRLDSPERLRELPDRACARPATQRPPARRRGTRPCRRSRTSAARRCRVPGAREGPGRRRARLRPALRGTCATARAFSECRAILRASVLIPRSTSHESNGPGTAPSDFWRKYSRSAIVGSLVAAKPADHVGVAAEVLRRGVDDDVGAELERPLQVRRRERVVDDDDRAGFVRRVGGGVDVDDVQQRVGRRLDPDQARALVEVRPRFANSVAGRYSKT